MTIQQIVQRRSITTLYHFTHRDNLSSIIEYGLISRAGLDGSKINYDYNDDDRIEGHLDAICLSISYPNAKMFYKYRMLKKGEWILLAINPAVLWENDCAFYSTNAASNNVRFQSLPLLKSFNAFDAMFAETVFSESRCRNLPNNYTTDVQAEVLVFSHIAPSSIIKILHPNKESADHFHALHPKKEHSYYANLKGKTLYSQRDYYLG